MIIFAIQRLNPSCHDGIIDPYIQTAVLQVEFQIHYYTQTKEVVQCHFSTSQKMKGVVPLQQEREGCWVARLPLPEETESLSYRYVIVGVDGLIVREEEGAERLVSLKERQLVRCIDTWFDTPIEHAFRHTAFAETLMSKTMVEPTNGDFHLRLYAPTPPKGYHWAVIGEAEWLGEWQSEKALRLKALDTNTWGLELSRSVVSDTAYKYILRSEYDPLQIVWEEGENRKLLLPAFSAWGHLIKADAAPKVPILGWRGAGIVVPVFSLRSEGSQGIGDFGDLRTLVEWAASVGMHAVQLLPINDTSASGTRTDSYPYNSISAFALHPLYLDLRPWCDLPFYQTYRSTFEQLNQQKELDYEGVYQSKMSFLRQLYEVIGVAIHKERKYEEFVKAHYDWLFPYAFFCMLRDKNKTADFRLWGDLKVGNTFSMEKYLEDYPQAKATITFYYFIQYLLFSQIEAVHAEARRQNILLKGDLPIGINRNGVDAWRNPHLFHFNGQAGAPPDAFAVKGQNWGFPTYNWEEMERDNYAWWRRRLEVMSFSFDAYRIDHVLGFFRIWEVPYEQLEGILGVFRPALPYTQEEIAAFGFSLSAEEYSYPYITKARLSELAACIPEAKIESYFTCQGERYYLKSEVDTQRKIAERVENEAVRSLLFEVCTEVLFIRDGQQNQCFHPRIAGQQTLIFRQLSPALQTAYTRLHDHYYYVRHNEFWAAEAVKKLSPLTQLKDGKGAVSASSSMLPCAEDLGMVPASVKGVLEQLHILSLEIQRMPKAYGVRFDDVAKNPYYSVATIATHDMPPLRLWWEREAADRQAYWQSVFKYSGEAPISASTDICQSIVAAHLASPSMLCLLAWQDWLSISESLRSACVSEEQINVPANPNHYWGYRIPITLEQLTAATDFQQTVRQMIARSGR